MKLQHRLGLYLLILGILISSLATSTHQPILGIVVGSVLGVEGTLLFLLE